MVTLVFGPELGCPIAASVLALVTAGCLAERRRKRLIRRDRGGELSLTG